MCRVNLSGSKREGVFTKKDTKGSICQDLSTLVVAAAATNNISNTGYFSQRKQLSNGNE
jgi:hypothetical protein